MRSVVGPRAWFGGSRRTSPLGLVGIAVAILLTTTVVAEDVASFSGDPSLDFRVEHPNQRLEMIVNSSRIVSSDSDIPRLLVNNPDIIRVTPLSPKQVQVSALKAGVTQVNLWDGDGKARTVDVIVFRDPRPLEMVLQSEFPKSAIRVRPLENSVILSGYVDRPEDVSRLVQIASDYYPSVINNINVGGVQQVCLSVRVMEVSRTKLRDLGIDWAAKFGDDFIAQTASGIASVVEPTAALSAVPRVVGNPGGGADTVRFGIVNDQNQFFGFIRALADRQLLKILAEPNLVTVSGRPASFQQGGQIPIPVPQGLGQTSVDFKDFGTRVDFVPIVLGNGNIRLEVRPSVTEIDPTIGTLINGNQVPGLRSRYVDTAVEMRSGQTLALAGLVFTRTEASKRGLPGLIDVPWIGAAFRNVHEEINEIELLVVVTPHLVAAMDPEQVPQYLPGERTAPPCNTDFYGR
ncbi:MAG TPA: pilus assembly protein N-terminal domain-containing protein, partial [Pirellulaceae bacterium]